MHQVRFERAGRAPRCVPESCKHGSANQALGAPEVFSRERVSFGLSAAHAMDALAVDLS